MKHGSWLIAALLTMAAACAAAPPEQAMETSRTVRFVYSANITGLPPGQSARIWLPIAHDMIEQRVTLEKVDLPAGWRSTEDAKFHNRIAYAEATAGADGSIPISLTYRVTRLAAGPEANGQRNDPVPAADYLRGDKLVPAGGHTNVLVAGRSLPADHTELAHALFDVVVDDLTYRKDKPGWGRGDANWACDSRFGNCTDFTSLFLSLARGQGIPAKFEIGFPLPVAHGHGVVDSYHCWGWFLNSQDQWTPVDLSHSKQNPPMRSYLFGHLDPDRIAFTVGRDIQLSPPQAGAPLNYFDYPYVEVNGAPLPAEHVKCHFTYEDLPAPASSTLEKASQ